MAASVGLLVYRAMQPGVVVPGRRPGTDAFLDAARFDGLETFQGTLIVRATADHSCAEPRSATARVVSTCSIVNVNAPVRDVMDGSGLSAPGTLLCTDADAIDHLERRPG